MPDDICREPECGKTAKASRGWCWGHYERWRRYGSPQAPVAWHAGESPIDRILKRVVRVGQCWTWTGHIAKNGYGKSGSEWVHRASYLAFVGPIPDGFDLDHLCRNRACVNPDHLEPVTRKENLRRGLPQPRRECGACGLTTRAGPLGMHIKYTPGHWQVPISS